MGQERSRRDMEQELRISQCMIVKDEIDNIGQALSWGRDMMWEQIVVDTGSSDGTREKAIQSGASLYDYPWGEDFSAAKNFALERARGDWIAFLDADEFIPQETAHRLPGILEECRRKGMDGVTVSMVNLNEDGTTWGAGTLVRFFRNDSSLRYRRPIHEQLAFEDGRRMAIGDATREITIYHKGYSGAVYEKKKRSGRNKQMIERELSDHPDSYEMMGYLGDEYHSEEDWNQAAQWYGRAIARMPDVIPGDDQRSAVTFSRMIDSLIRLKRDEALLSCYGKAAALFPGEGDYDYLMGRYFMEEGDYAQGEHHILLAFKKLERYGFNGRAMIVMANLEELYVNLAECQYRQDKLEEGVCTATGFLKKRPYHMKMLYILLSCFCREEGEGNPSYARQAAAFLQTLYDCSSMKNRLFIWKTARQAEYNTLARIMEEMMGEEERQLLKP